MNPTTLLALLAPLAAASAVDGALLASRLAFFVLVAGIVLLPGLDMAFVLASSLVGGRRAGLAAVGGIVAGGACHVAMGALGVASVLHLMPAAFNAVLLAGALYVAWIGCSLWRAGDLRPPGLIPPHRGPAGATAERTLAATFRRGAATNLLNPKAYLFMLAVFPQFVRPSFGPLWTQALTLGGIIAFTQVGIYGALAVLAGRAGGLLATRPGVARTLGRGIGVVLLLAALYTGIQGWRGVG